MFRGKHSIHSHDKVLRDCRQNVKTNIYVLVSSKVNFKPVQNIFYRFLNNNKDSLPFDPCDKDKIITLNVKTAPRKRC